MSSSALFRANFIIDGKVCQPSTQRYNSVLNPATGEIIAEVGMGGRADVDLAVVAAKTAFESSGWPYLAPKERAVVLRKCAQLIAVNSQELALLEVRDSGGTINRIAGMDLPGAVQLFMSMADIVEVYPFVENLPSAPVPEMVHTQVWKEPVGVCGLITPWNFPIMLCLMKLVPALAAGNTVIIKPAEITPLSTIRMVELLQQVLPKGVLNVVVGDGSVVGEAMSLHPDIDKISFTGSGAVGRRVQQNAAISLKRVTLELGGKGPGIVRPGVDLDLLASGALWGVYLNSGQICKAGSRLLVHESIYDDVVTKLVDYSSRVVVGDPMDTATGIGPMATEAHYHKVLNYINSAVAEGASIACGGTPVIVEGCRGFFVAATVLINVTNSMKVAQEEIFGPVIAVIKYSTLDEAINIANDTPYGLSAGVWTADFVEGQQIARRLRAGSVWINDWNMERLDAPFGGFKQSGYGRELGSYGLDEYLETKTVSIAFERNVNKKLLHRLVHTKSA